MLRKNCFDPDEIPVIIKKQPVPVEEVDDLPEIECLADIWDNPPDLAGELIEGVLRKGHKMLLAGPSKAGKSFSLLELAICIAEGRPWLGFNCTQGRVMYINLELDPASCLHRIKNIYKALDQKPNHAKNITVWNLRGYTEPLNRLAPKIIQRARHNHYLAIIIDPIYKALTGNENNASQMARFCGYFEQIAYECNSAIIYCHHHSKGEQSWKTPMDRASGSGVFARDPDAILDMIELELPLERRREGVTAWRITGVLREFQDFPPHDVWFNYPLHILEHFAPEDNIAPHHELPSFQRAMNARKPKEQKLKERKRRLEAAFDICAADGPVTISTLADYLGVSLDTIRRSVDEHPDFKRENGVISRGVQD